MKKFISMPVVCLLLALLMLIDFCMIFFYAPIERHQGLVQKIFYWHVSAAFAMYAGFLLAGFFALLYVWKRERKWDVLSHAGATVGLVFCTMVLVSGPIWAKPIWGTWWTWDPRLTTTMLIWLIFVGTLLLRRYFIGDHRGQLYAAVLTLFGVLDIPLIFFAVKFWRGIHPSVLGQENNMPLEMKLTLMISNLTVLCFFGLLFGVKRKSLWLEYRVDALCQDWRINR